MTLPRLPERSVKIAGLQDELIVRAMSARCYVDLVDAREANKSEVEVAAIVAHHCVPAWSEHSPEEIMAEVEAPILVDVMVEITNMIAETSRGNSKTGQPVSSSSS